MPAQIFTDSERPDLYDRLDEVADPWPEFIHHDDVVVERWPLLHERLPDFQLILYDSETDAVLGRGCTIPVSWDGRNESLSGGVVDGLVEGFADVAEANVLCALVAVVDPRQQGRGLSGYIIRRNGRGCRPSRPRMPDRARTADLEGAAPARPPRGVHVLDA
jgi:hypothetical protein